LEWNPPFAVHSSLFAGADTPFPVSRTLINPKTEIPIGEGPAATTMASVR
jgi:hypothetical protein